MAFKGDNGEIALYRGSGTLIGSRHILTAAHNLWDRKTKLQPESITFSPGYSGGKYHLIFNGDDINFHPSYVTPSYDRSGNKEARNHDIGLVSLDKDIKLPNFFSIKAFNDNFIFRYNPNCV